MGWKTYVGGVGAILTGLGGAAQAAANSDWPGVWSSLLVAFGGLVAVGLGHKIEKLKAALEQVFTKKK